MQYSPGLNKYAVHGVRAVKQPRCVRKCGPELIESLEDCPSLLRGGYCLLS
jgi:hypothetical protein